MRGHITKRGKNSYTIVLSLGIDPATGKRKQQWVSVKGTKKDAEKRLSELLTQLDTGGFVRPSKTTLGEYLDQWVKDYCQANLAPTTAQTYQFFVKRHIKPALSKVTLTQLKPEHLQHLYTDKLSTGLGKRSVRYIHITLHKALKDAVKLGMIARNPADAVTPPRVQRSEMQTWDEDEIKTFLEAIKDSPYYALFYTALYTGMRRNELLGLRWSDIDIPLSLVYVNRSLLLLKNGEITFRTPKTSKGRRAIDLPPSLTLLLKEYREKQALDRAMLGIPITDNDLVFSQYDGKPLLPDSVTHAWIKLVRRAGVKPIRLHDTRHTMASLMLKQGVHPKIVQERLGHASIQITLDTYSHVAPGLQKAAAERFDELVNHTPKNEAAGKFG
jgi:integrase